MKKQLKEAKGKGITIVVIDSGVDISHPLLSDCRISQKSFAIREEDNHLCMDDDITDKFGHGTAVCGILSKLVPDAVLIVVKIFDESGLRADERKLVYALQKIYDSVECDVIHFSIGSVVLSKELQLLCKKLFEKGVRMVAAYDNAGAVSYPANFTEVIGVDSDIRCKNVDDFIMIEGDRTTIFAKGGVHRLAWTEPRYIISQGTSFSAPYVSGYLAKMLSIGVSKKEIIAEFRNISKKVISVSDSKENQNLLEIPFKINRAVLFPYNKEMHSLLNYSHHLGFKIETICDNKYTGRVGTTVTSIQGENSSVVRNLEDVDWTKIDTLILGHMDELEIMSETRLKQDVLDLCFRNRINVYSFDNHGISKKEIKRFEKEGLHIFTPQINDISCLRQNMGKMYQYGVPVLAVFGTTSQQGKFTLQMAMRYRLLDLGYSVAQVGTEPSALLYGCDGCFPFGHNGTVDLKEGEFILAINSLIHEIESKRKETDILLVGSQSGTVPLIYNHINQMTIREIEFLMGAMPDAVVLCVNADDDINLIKRAICAIESVGATKVVAIAMYPMVYANGWQQLNQVKRKGENIECIREEIEKNVNRPVYVMGDANEINLLCEQCINYLAGE